MNDPATTAHRRTIRLPDYDYTQAGGYFVTICTHERQHLFGRVVNDAMQLSAYGEIATNAWLEAISMRAELNLDAFVVMPNHMHGIVVITERGPARGLERGPERITSPERTPVRHYEAGGDPERTPVRHYEAGQHARDAAPMKRTLGRFVAAYKGAVTTAINTQRGTSGAPVWQQNYYEHVIRNGEDMMRIRDYIATNPARWSTDPENITRAAPP